MKFLFLEFKNSTPLPRWIFRDGEPSGPSGNENNEADRLAERAEYVQGIKNDINDLKNLIYKAKSHSIKPGDERSIDEIEDYDNPFEKNSISDNVDILKKLAQGEAIFEDRNNGFGTQKWGDDSSNSIFFDLENQDGHSSAFEEQKKVIIAAMPSDAIGRFLSTEKGLAMELFTDQKGAQFRVDFYGHEALEGDNQNWRRLWILPKKHSFLKIKNDGKEEVVSLLAGFNSKTGKFKASYKTIDDKFPEIKTGTIITPVIDPNEEAALKAKYPDRVAKKDDFEGFQNQELGKEILKAENQDFDKTLNHLGNKEVASQFLTQLFEITGESSGKDSKQREFEFHIDRQLGLITSQNIRVKRLRKGLKNVQNKDERDLLIEQIAEATNKMRQIKATAISKISGAYSKTIQEGMASIESNFILTPETKQQKFKALRNLGDETFAEMTNHVKKVKSQTERLRDQNTKQIEALLEVVAKENPEQYTEELIAQLIEAVDRYDNGDSAVGKEALVSMLSTLKDGKESPYRAQFTQLVNQRAELNFKYEVSTQTIETQLNKQKIQQLAVDPEFRATIREYDQILGEELAHNLLNPPYKKTEEAIESSTELDIDAYKVLLTSAYQRILAQMGPKNEDRLYPVLEKIKNVIGEIEKMEEKVSQKNIAEQNLRDVRAVTKALNDESGELTKRLDAAHAKFLETGEISTDVWSSYQKEVASHNASTFNPKLSESPTYVKLTPTEQQDVAETLSSMPDGTVLTGVDKDGNPIIQLGPNGSLAKLDLNRAVPQIIVKPTSGVDGEKVEMDLTRENAPVAAITAAVMNARVVDNTATQVERFEATGFDLGYVKFVKNMLGATPRYPHPKQLEGIQMVEREHPGGFIGYLGNTLGGFKEDGKSLDPNKGSDANGRFWTDMSAAAAGNLPQQNPLALT